MAQGDLVVFDEAKLGLLDGTHDLDTDVYKVMFINDTTVPTAADATPAKADYTAVNGGNFPVTPDTMAVTLVEAAGTVTFDMTTNISYAKDVGNPTDVFYAVCYNDTDGGKAALFFVEMDAAGFDATGGLTSLTWGANVFTLT